MNAGLLSLAGLKKLTQNMTYFLPFGGMMCRLDVDSGDPDELASRLLSFSCSVEFDKSDIWKNAFSLKNRAKNVEIRSKKKGDVEV